MPGPGDSSYWAEERHRAIRYKDLRSGGAAGILGGMSVMAFFLGYDALFFSPLATPDFLTATFLGQDASPLFQMRGAPIAFFSILHLTVFAALGVLLAALFRIIGVRKSLLLGGLYGLAVCTTLFAVVLYLSGTELMVEPQWVAMMLSNFLAGVVMVGYLKAREVLFGESTG